MPQFEAQSQAKTETGGDYFLDPDLLSIYQNSVLWQIEEHRNKRFTRFDLAGLVSDLAQEIIYSNMMIVQEIRKLRHETAALAATWQQGSAAPAATATNDSPARD